jgi:hypothetical protein
MTKEDAWSVNYSAGVMSGLMSGLIVAFSLQMKYDGAFDYFKNGMIMAFMAFVLTVMGFIIHYGFEYLRVRKKSPKKK